MGEVTTKFIVNAQLCIFAESYCIIISITAYIDERVLYHCKIFVNLIILQIQDCQYRFVKIKLDLIFSVNAVFKKFFYSILVLWISFVFFLGFSQHRD